MANDSGNGAGKANVTACVMQNGQCSRWCSTESVEDFSGVAWSMDTSFVPVTVHTSVMLELPLAADKAWEMEGASALSRIARHAIQICNVFRLRN